MSDTIAAIATANGEGAVAILRLSGPDTFQIASSITDTDLSSVPGYSIKYGTIKDQGEVVDQVLFSVFRAPHSYTGEDVLEISCHGGLYISRRILSLLLGHGARLARRGEFTERAFLHGKMNLSQAEAVNDLIKAKDEVNARSSIHALNGSVKKILDPLTEELTQILAQIEVNIDYPEYNDVEELRDEQILPQAQQWLVKMDALIEKAQQAVTIREGIDTVLLGRPNVGKSSLLNALLEEDKAIVTDIAGTTRDIVEGTVRIGDVTLNLIDTAGIHEANDSIEKIGIEKSIQALQKAQLVLLVLDSSTGITEEDEMLMRASEGKPRILVYNKKDKNEMENVVSISALNKDIEPLKEAIQDLFEEGILAAKSDTLNNQRQIGLAMQARSAMNSAVTAMSEGCEVDLVTIDLQNAWYALKEIVGEAGREDLLDEIFSRFCLGK